MTSSLEMPHGPGPQKGSVIQKGRARRVLTPQIYKMRGLTGPHYGKCSLGPVPWNPTQAAADGAGREPTQSPSPACGRGPTWGWGEDTEKDMLYGQAAGA